MRHTCFFIALQFALGCSSRSETTSVTQGIHSCDPNDGITIWTFWLFRDTRQVSEDVFGTQEPSWLFTPAVVPVTAGQAGNYVFTLDWHAFDGQIGSCLYRGTGSATPTPTCTNNGDEYRLLFCTTKAQILAKNCRVQPDRCIDDPEVLSATPVPRGGLLEGVTLLWVEGFNGQRCSPAHDVRATLVLNAPPDQDHDGTPECLIADTVPPTWPAPHSLTATIAADRSPIMEWLPAADNVAVTGYRLYQDGILVRSLDGLTLRATLPPLTSDSLHSFRVEAIDAAGNESLNGPRTEVYIDTAVPAWPPDSMLLTSPGGSSAVTVTWPAASDAVGVASYRILRDGVQAREVEPSVTTATFADLLPEIDYTFQVQATDSAGNVTSDGPSAVVRLDGLAPTWPQESLLTARATQPTDVVLEWTPATDNVAVSGYRIYLGGLPVRDVAGDLLITTVSGLPVGPTLRFQVQAFDAAGNSTMDGPTADHPQMSDAPAWPQGARVTAAGNVAQRTVRLLWDAANDDVAVTGYLVFANGVQVLEAPPIPLAVIPNMSVGQHRFAVRAVDADGNQSAELSVQLELEENPPTWPPGSVVTGGPAGILNILVVEWTAAVDDIAVNRYRVFRNGTLAAEVSERSASVLVLSGSAVEVTVQAIDSSGNVTTNGPTAIARIDRDPPLWPATTEIRTSARGPGTTRIAWTPANDSSAILRYDVYRDGAKVGAADANARSFDLVGLVDSQQYTIRISSLDAWANVSASDPSLTIKPDASPPTWPASSSLMAAQVSPGGAHLTWTPAEDNIAVSNYRIFLDDVLAAEAAGASRDAPVSGLGAKTSYSFRIQAVDARGHVADGPSFELPFDNEAPTWPTGSEAAATATSSTVMLTWTAANDNVGVHRYLVYVNKLPMRLVPASQRSTELPHLRPDTSYAVTVEALDAVGHITSDGPSAEVRTSLEDPLPPLDPPPSDATKVTTTFASTAFLYTGDNPVQRGVAEGTIKREQGALLRGRVTTSTGHPISNVTISVMHHPELGSTETRLDGEFSLVVNGATTLTLEYFHPDHLLVHRRVAPSWKDTVWAEDVVLIPMDPAVTEIEGNASFTQIARGSPQQDADGERQATLIFPPGTTATMTTPDGSEIPLESFHVRATEYTVGPSGRAAMPAPLPPISAYTYAVELSADEARQAGATRVSFDKPGRDLILSDRLWIAELSTVIV